MRALITRVLRQQHQQHCREQKRCLSDACIFAAVIRRSTKNRECPDDKDTAHSPACTPVLQLLPTYPSQGRVSIEPHGVGHGGQIKVEILHRLQSDAISGLGRAQGQEEKWEDVRMETSMLTRYFRIQGTMSERLHQGSREQCQSEEKGLDRNQSCIICHKASAAQRNYSNTAHAQTYRVRLPESLLPSKVREPRVNPHACSSQAPAPSRTAWLVSGRRQAKVYSPVD